MFDISNEIDQVFLIASPLPKPLQLAMHSWLVTNKSGLEVNRWEVWQQKYQCSTSWGHVHKNMLPADCGMNSFFIHGKHGKRWNAQVLGKVEGDLATEMIRFIEFEAPRYPFAQLYWAWPGPNSNTFVQWILNAFPECGLKLPKHALGARFYSKVVKERSYKIPERTDFFY